MHYTDRRSGLTENLSLSLVVRVSLHDEAPASPPAQDGASPHQPQTTPHVGVDARSAVARFPVVHRQSLDWGNHPTSSNFRKSYVDYSCRSLLPNLGDLVLKCQDLFTALSISLRV